MRNQSVNSWLKLRFVLGFYYDISDSKCARYFLKLYCVVICVLLSYLHISIYGNHLHVIITVFEYVFNVVLSLMTRQKRMFKYLSALKTSDALMGIDTIPLLNFEMYLLLIVVFMFRIYIVYFHRAFHIYNSCLVLIAVDLNHSLPTLLFLSLYFRMKIIMSCLKNNSVSVNIVGKFETSKNVVVIRKCLNYYNNMLDNAHLFFRDIQYMITVTFVVNVPKWIITTYWTISSQNRTWSIDILAEPLILDTVYAVIIVCSSSLIAEMIINEIDKIKSVLATQLFRCSDESLKFEMEVMLRYMELRPFKFTVAGAVPLNVNLPITIGALCISYVVIALQLNHFKVFTFI